VGLAIGLSSRPGSIDPRSGLVRRHHLDEQTLQWAVKKAVREAGIPKPASCHTLRHSFATHLLRSGYNIRTVQDLLGHKDVSTTMVYIYVLNRGGRGVRSPLDAVEVSPVFFVRPPLRCEPAWLVETRSSPVPDRACGLRTVGCITLCRVPLPTPFLTGFTSPEAPFHGSEAGKRCSEARFRASEAGSRGSEARFRASDGGRRGPGGRLDDLEGGMNGPLAGICTSGARVRRHVGGERNGAARPAAPKIVATREDPDELRCLAARRQFPGKG